MSFRHFVIALAVVGAIVLAVQALPYLAVLEFFNR
jgi:hypothetical protein